MKKFAHTDEFLHKSAKREEENALFALLSQSLMRSRQNGEKDVKSEKCTPEVFKSGEKAGQNASLSKDSAVSRGGFDIDKRKLLSALEETDENNENGIFEQNFFEESAKNRKNSRFAQIKNCKNGENCDFSQNYQTENCDFCKNPQNKHFSDAKNNDVPDTRQEKYDGLDEYCVIPPYYMRH